MKTKGGNKSPEPLCCCGHSKSKHAAEGTSCLAVHHKRTSGEEVYCPCWRYEEAK